MLIGASLDIIKKVEKIGCKQLKIFKLLSEVNAVMQNVTKCPMPATLKSAVTQQTQSENWTNCVQDKQPSISKKTEEKEWLWKMAAQPSVRSPEDVFGVQQKKTQWLDMSFHRIKYKVFEL